jgi:hypothetical protein
MNCERLRVHRRWTHLLALAAFALSGNLAAAPQAKSGDDADIQRFLAVSQRWNKDPDTFPAYVEAKAFPREAGASYTGQIVAMLASELGMYDTAIAEWPLGTGQIRSATSPPPASDAQVADAAETIARLALGHRVVIVNEAHHVGQTRAIFLDLLPKLRQQGFDWYCAETFDASDVPRLRQQGYPVRKTGVYTREPLFGEVVRSASRLGYSPCAYECEGTGGQQARETGQAENLAKLLREHPDARVLVHAGYGHAREDITVADAKPMAAELTRLTGIDPLTVDQTTFGAVATQPLEYPAYRALLARLGGATRASVFLDGAGSPWSLEPAAYDISVILPAPPASHGRAGWLWQIEGKQVVASFDADCTGHYPCAIEARHAGESDDAVPADIVVREAADAPAPALALFPGAYVLRVVAPDGQRLRDAVLDVAVPDGEGPAQVPPATNTGGETHGS